ncbi:MAG: tetratricopeptide repeat protein [Pirellulales bacterium]
MKLQYITTMASLLLLLFGTYVGADVVRTESGAQTGTISIMSKESVRLTKGGSDTDIPVNQIIEVSFDNEPFQAKEARQMIQNGQLEDALEKIKGIKPDTITGHVKHEINFMQASTVAKLALSGSFDKKAAADQVRAFASTAPNNWHFYQAAELMGDLASASGSYAEASTYYGVLANAPWPDFQMKALVLTGQALLAQKKPAEALAKFEQVLKMKASTTGANRQKDIATVGKVSCLAQTGKFDDGIKLAQQVIDKGNPNDAELFAQAYNSLGACYMQKKQPNDAVLAYLHVDILFYYSNPELHAEALYNLSIAWKQINRPDDAVSARDLLRSRYPGSIWATKP